MLVHQLDKRNAEMEAEIGGLTLVNDDDVVGNADVSAVATLDEANGIAIKYERDGCLSTLFLQLGKHMMQWKAQVCSPSPSPIFKLNGHWRLTPHAANKCDRKKTRTCLNNAINDEIDSTQNTHRATHAKRINAQIHDEIDSTQETRWGTHTKKTSKQLNGEIGSTQETHTHTHTHNLKTRKTKTHVSTQSWGDVNGHVLVVTPHDLPHNPPPTTSSKMVSSTI